MTTLLYHASGAGTSPFDEAVLRVARHNAIKIISPYIGLRYLQRLIDVSTGWTLVSDIEAWLSSLSSSERARVLPFIHTNLDKIRHYPAIHAKTVISSKLAYLGSANLTAMGILNRTEMGVLLEDIRLVQELNEWFDGLWTQTAPPDIAEITEFVQWLDQQALTAVASPSKKFLSSNGKKVRAHLTNLADLEAAPSQHPTTKPEAAEQQKQEKAATIVDIYEAGAVIALVDTLVAKGFTFRDFMQAAHRQVIKHEQQRELYFALLPFCANHSRSVFAEGTINRLLFVGGMFVQSTLILLNEQQAPYDGYLSNLILALSFDKARVLPSSVQLRKLTGLREAHQRHLVNGLVESGLLRQADNTGNSPAQYTLKENFKWSGRFQLFTNAYKNWNKGLSRLRPITPLHSLTSALVPFSPSPSTTIKAQAITPVADQYIVGQPAVISKNAPNAPEAPKTTEKENAPVRTTVATVKPVPAAITPTPMPRLAKAIRIIREPDRNNFIQEIEDEAVRIDELYLNLAKILEPTNGFFSFKSTKDFATYIYTHYQENQEFIEQVLLSNKLFHVSITPERQTTSCAVKLNMKADMSDYPKTFNFMKEAADLRTNQFYKGKKTKTFIQSNPNPGFFAKRVSYRALVEWVNDDALRKTAFAKEEARLAIRNTNKEAATLKAIKKLYERANHSDQVFESLLFYVQLYGNPLPLESRTEVFEKIAGKTQLKPEYIKEILENQASPLILSISMKDSDSFCRVDLNRFYSGNFETLPRTKKLLETASLN